MPVHIRTGRRLLKANNLTDTVLTSRLNFDEGGTTPNWYRALDLGLALKKRWALTISLKLFHTNASTYSNGQKIT